jgi:hypothetical protein
MTALTDAELAAEVAGMVSDGIGSRLRYEQDGDPDFPLAENFRPDGDAAVIDLNDGRRLRITVQVETPERPEPPRLPSVPVRGGRLPNAGNPYPLI